MGDRSSLREIQWLLTAVTAALLLPLEIRHGQQVQRAHNMICADTRPAGMFPPMHIPQPCPPQYRTGALITVILVVWAIAISALTLARWWAWRHTSEARQHGLGLIRMLQFLLFLGTLAVLAGLWDTYQQEQRVMPGPDSRTATTMLVVVAGWAAMHAMLRRTRSRRQCARLRSCDD